jgi:hypothetical protein
MAVYRAIHRLSGVTVQRGHVIPPGLLDERQISILAARGAISLVAAPPLALLPGWDARAAMLSGEGIVDGAQLIEADAGALADRLDVSANEVQAWQQEMVMLLSPPTDDGCACG